jgi:monoamine oxidase
VSVGSADELDVAVVGGGAAGLYCAWRIAAEKPDARVAVFEASDRTGGRLRTMTPPDAPALRAELGGIAVISTHALVVAVTDALGLEREPLAGGDPSNLLYLRGRRFRAEQWNDPDAVPYNLADRERGRTPERIFADAVQVLVPDAVTLTPPEWDEVKRTLRVGEQALADVGLWNLLRERLSPEAFRLISDAGGFRPEFQNWNAAEALVDMSAGWPAEARYERLADGFEALPRALARRFEEDGGEVALGHRLRRIRTGAPGGPLELELEVEGSARIVAARSVILALPQHALELLAPSTPLDASPEFERDLSAVGTVPLVHLFLAYEQPWWEALEIGSGRSATDLPIQSCFYFGTEGERPGADPGNRRSLAMVGYSSAEAIEYWDAYLGGSSRGAEPRPEAPPPEMLAEVTRQLAELHGIDVPDPYWARLMDWRSELYGGASHRWAIGARSWEVIPRMRRPLPEAPIHVCGEAWSDLQGWTEGAFRSAERVLRDELGLQRPEWMSADAYLGP